MKKFATWMYLNFVGPLPKVGLKELEAAVTIAEKRGVAPAHDGVVVGLAFAEALGIPVTAVQEGQAEAAAKTAEAATLDVDAANALAVAEDKAKQLEQRAKRAREDGERESKNLAEVATLSRARAARVAELVALAS